MVGTSCNSEQGSLQWGDRGMTAISGVEFLIWLLTAALDHCGADRQHFDILFKLGANSLHDGSCSWRTSPDADSFTVPLPTSPLPT